MSILYNDPDAQFKQILLLIKYGLQQFCRILESLLPLCPHTSEHIEESLKLNAFVELI
jgi:hypothetical protein